jgi:hypothetical protein
MYIPIGIDCGNAEILKSQNKRNCSFPFDWVVTYQGVSEIIKNKFNNYIPDDCNKFNKYGTLFVHHHFPNDREKMIRRINRLLDALNQGEEKIIFIKKGHFSHHHQEFSNIKSDIQDSIDLDNIMKEMYPTTKYEIHLVLKCHQCFSYIPVIDNTDTLKIYNISRESVTVQKSDEMFESIISNL